MIIFQAARRMRPGSIAASLWLTFVMLVGQAGAAAPDKLIVYGDRNIPPYEFLQDGTPQGAMVDLTRAIAERMGKKPDIILQKWPDSQAAVLAGSGHALSFMSKTKEREAIYDFSADTFPMTYSLFVLADRRAHFDARKLSGLRIAVTDKSFPQGYLKENHREVNVVVVEDYGDGIRRVLRREADAFLAATWPGEYFLSELNISGIDVVSPPLMESPAAMAIPKGRPELVSAINLALFELRADGTIDRIIDKWSAKKVYVLTQNAVARVTWLAGGVGLVLLLTIAFVWMLRRQRNALATEVAERRRAGEALRASEEKYRTLFSNMSEGFALCELIYDAGGKPVDYRLLEANEALYRETGLHHGILERPAREYLPELEQYWLDAYHQVITQGGAVRLENYNADTQRHYDLCAFRPTPGRFAIVFRDITEIKRVERALAASERDLRQLIATLPGMVWICDAKGQIEFMSQQWLDYTGMPLESELGTGGFESVHPADRPYIGQRCQEAFAGTSPFHVEYRLRRHDGLYRWFKSRGTPLLDESGQAVRWLGVVIDIDDLKQVEAALAQERDRARGYLQMAGVALLVLDSEGCIRTINRRGAEMLGYTDETRLVGLNWFELAIPLRIRKQLRADFGKMIAGTFEMPMDYENLVVRADGCERLIAWRNTVVHDEHGRVVGTLSSGEDVTEARQATALLARDKAELERLVEERTAQLVQLQKMEAIGQLTGGVAHDFNNVLQGLASCLFVLERHVPEGPPRTLFEAAQRSIESGARLTQALLAYARRQTLAPESVDLRKLVENLRPLLESTLGGLIRVRVEVADDTPSALVDRAQLESAILNLAINARDAMATGGSLTLRAGSAALRGGEPGRPLELKPGEYATISVEDTGCGMDEATRARAFEPFFTTKDFGKGSGLGLSMVHGMAVQSGGGVWITSQPGRGTTVTLYLPPARPAARAHSPAKAVVASGDGSTVLLVDDNDLMRNALKITLESLGYHVLSVNGGEAALAVLRESDRVDALVTDYAMPGMNGAELTREARRIAPDLPVVLITGYAERLKDMDGITLLHKPFQTQDLVATLASLFRSKVPGAAEEEAGEHARVTVDQ